MAAQTVAEAVPMTHYFKSQGVRIAYDDVGNGAPIVLLHGFSASRRLNWKLPGWYDTLNAAGYRVIAFDARGHGQSDGENQASPNHGVSELACWRAREERRRRA